MNGKDFNELIEKRFGECLEVMTAKGADYSDATRDRQANFKIIAKLIRDITGSDTIEITPGLIWTIYYFKHVIPVVKVACGGSLTSEPIEGRITDVINYPVLLEGLLRDAQAPPAQYSDHMAFEAPADETPQDEQDETTPQEKPTLLQALANLVK